ncbi:ATP-binding cassette domain-containing protein [Arenicella xantha]|uniref:ABC-type lipoprotein export system ATPase subunit n=1 Tax=Arenicella xantha TaxID=644221 RepID=A0A395JNH2_9GAMM|nr:ATP-binding cassette domain-containing protein [Arenicella xantha]RBP53214.1 ABC-type lipoprotein export system ATPase subunit [Arenicella xantha]
MLEIRSLSYRLGDGLLFDALDLVVERGEHCVIVGGSGSGKSTLLTLIAEQRLAEISVPSGSVVAMVLQQGALLDHLSVRANLELVARYNPDRYDPTSIDSLLSRLNIGPELHNARISQLSGGQQRRVSIARALLTQPDLIIFDEPDAGLDIHNLSALAMLVAELAEEYQCACLTVSHNPIYIAGVASKVFRLKTGKLESLADWGGSAGDASMLHDRQQSLLSQLSTSQHLNTNANTNTGQSSSAKPSNRALSKIRSKQLVFIVWLKQVILTWLSVWHWPRSLRDEMRIAAYTVYLSFVSGILFFALVGLMLGTTTVAVVQMLSDTALTGLIRLFIKPDDLIQLMGGRYVLYLAPAIGGMLFAARSGSIMSNWLGELVRGKQTQALKLLGVPPSQYLTAPALIGLFVSMIAAIVWFAVCVWFGGVIATQHLFGIADPAAVMSVSAVDVTLSSFWFKTFCYSLIVASTVVALGLAPKQSSHQVNIHTTKTIIYSTLSIALLELLIILSR